ncbi:MAG: N-acetyl-gamma-glutamyl-phosphate reductase [Alphaproteobacteria bacterium]|nr:N-acetyl-gamma-glutamyl-phosphate reductase [Alphaproteobacteria bacterium]
MTRIFIDGEAGTTGLEIRERLAGRTDLSFLSLGEAERKDGAARARALKAADIAILCLPDEAAREAVALIGNSGTRVIDASTAHRTAPGWTYGFPELRPGQGAAIAGAARVSNPGCYPTGVLVLLGPLLRAGLLPADHPVTINAVSGYSGGGRKMIAAFEDERDPDFTREAFRLYGLSLRHKHVEEMRVHAGLVHRPLFVPSVARFYRGMLVSIPLVLDALPGRPSLGALQDCLERAYAGTRDVSVLPAEKARTLDRLDPEAGLERDGMTLYVFGTEGDGQALLVARLDNLGKGAAGQAVRNLDLMIGHDDPREARA